MIDLIAPLYLAGLIGSLGMDIISPLASRLGFNTGVTMALIGRWFIGLFKGKFIYGDVRQSTAEKHEVIVGWLFHYLIGGGAVALLFLPVVWFSGTDTLPTAATPWIIFGLITSTLPWLVLMPSYGWGLFGRNGPQGTRPLIASPLNHLGYGIGLYLAVLAMSYSGLSG